jgi:hypothetical protein
MHTMNVIDIARLFLFVREVAPNSGNRVEAIQKWGGGEKGQSWCCWFVTMILDLFYSGKSPIPRLGACQDVYDLARKNAWLTMNPSVGDIFLYVNEKDHAHHIGFITSTQPLNGIAGNTSEDGKSSNGDRVAEHGIGGSQIRYVHYQ